VYANFNRQRRAVGCTIKNTGQQILTFFLSHEIQYVNLAVIFMLNSDMYTEFLYQVDFQRYRGI